MSGSTALLEDILVNLGRVGLMSGFGSMMQSIVSAHSSFHHLPNSVRSSRFCTAFLIPPFKSGPLTEVLFCQSAVQSCALGPGRSCPIDQYAELIKKKFRQQGTFASICDIPESNVTRSPSGGVTFFTDLTLPSIRTVKP